MKEDWAEKLKQKLEGHQKTPPVGLWEDISKEMGFEAKPVQQKPAPIRRWYWAVAAAVLALVGFFVFQDNNNEQPLQAEATSQKPISPKQVISSPVDNEPSIQTPVLALAQTSKPIHTIQKEEPTKQEKSEAIIPEEVTHQKEEKALENEAATTPPESELAQASEPKLNKEKTLQNLPDEWTTDDFTRESSHKWSLSINASGGLLASNNSKSMGRVYYDSFANEKSDFNNIGSSYNPNLPYTITENVAEHHLPIRLGVSLNYQLSTRLAVLSGISYTYLYSEFKIPLYSNASYDQKLHFLGIPLGLSYQLWAANRFQIYLSGGLMLEKCLNEKPWQWSVEASAGIEYSIIRQLGLYMEPSLGYYFKDGTSFEHYYKEHPLSPSIEFGLRLHINE